MLKKLAILLVLAAAAFGWIHHQRAARRPADGPLVLYGNVDIRELALGFRVPGRLEAVLKDEGDPVAAGEVLARLEARPYEEDLAVKDAQVRETEARLANAERNLARLGSLLSARSLAQSDYDEALTVRDELLARLDTVKAQRALSVTALGDVVLSSPSPGTIITRVREPGSVVGAGEIVCTVSLDRPVWVRAYLDEPDLGRVRPGQGAVVTTDSGGRYEGRVGFISPRAEFTPRTVETAALRTDLVFRLRIVVDNPDSGLRQGMPVTVELADEPPAAGGRAPEAAAEKPPAAAGENAPEGAAEAAVEAAGENAPEAAPAANQAAPNQPAPDKAAADSAGSPRAAPDAAGPAPAVLDQAGRP